MKSKHKPHYAWVILMCCCVMMGSTYGIEGGVTGSFFQPVSRAFRVPVSLVSGYVTVKGITTVLMLPLAGKLLHTKSSRTVLSLASLGYGACLLLMAASPNIAVFYIGAVALGMCGAFLTGITAPILICNWFHKDSGLALGIAMASSGLCGSVFGPLITKIIHIGGFRSGYLTMALIVLFLLLPMMLFLVRFKPEKGQHPYGGERTLMKVEHGEKILNCSLKRCFFSLSFLSVMVFGICLAFSNGILFNMTMLVNSGGFTVQNGALATSLALIGATFWKIVYGWLDKYLRVCTVVLLAVLTGAAGLLLVLLGGGLMTVYAGAFLYGSIVSLMTLEPPLLVKEIFGPDKSEYLFIYVSMAVQLSYAAAPMFYAALYDVCGSYRVSILLCTAIAMAAVIAGFLAVRLRRHLLGAAQG